MFLTMKFSKNFENDDDEEHKIITSNAGVERRVKPE